ncbi:hypothetical protein PLA107_001710 [Pseudomonas amygdali pv. lachrymans str. M301315]|uniref:Uncharacterized protein n=1 Tax=Pseudomonas amygdali pv. lachrymans str. M301315 TaxID=629260 RepID=A0AAD0LVE2_PSEAV|nr:hypothetical protein PLA107_001710 [Pseudomonas amygdali pv. lachrymans str. M301315]
MKTPEGEACGSGLVREDGSPDISGECTAPFANKRSVARYAPTRFVYNAEHWHKSQPYLWITNIQEL